MTIEFKNIQPINGNILVQDEEQKEKTESGIYLPSNASQDQIIRGTVVNISKNWTDEKGNVKTIEDIEIGDKVLYSFHAGAGNSIKEDGITYRIIKNQEILSILE